ncbi:CxxxxCH/CxxCH domain-containing protein [Geobacter sp. DSM 9736]|uniref:CxxxxCH/CxxCH domain c-type cytochrome n=1 Tax=Geobacter sp. DSM 9736 TaxID=1277350 RepID=UPI000B50FD0B|nr:CxxxxCH/CxxCH domain-containing protein [Geobacter sp. DSM 9736]SNB46071.1 Geobacter sulfurreducens CxxxxCH...CXXCH domain-containing protein [Geobacter sp. DSM 9736]
MGKRIEKHMKAMGWRGRLCLTLSCTLLLTLSLVWLAPLVSDSATNTYYFTLDSSPQYLGVDGYTDDEVRRNGMISMRTGTYNTERYVTAVSSTSWQRLMTVYGPAYATSQTLSAPSLRIGTRDNHGTSNPIYWKADVYSYDPSGAAGNGVLLWSTTGTDESHSYSAAPLSLTFGDQSARTIPANHRLKVMISCRMTSTNSEARLYWGRSTTYSYFTVTEAASAINTVTVTNLADYNGGALSSVLLGEGHVAMLRFDLYSNTNATWTGGKLDKIGSNQNLADVSYSVYKDTNNNGLFDVASDMQIGGPFNFTQPNGSAYALSAPQALSAVPQRYFITFSIAGNAATLTTIGGRIVDDSYFTVNSGVAVTNVRSTSSSMPTIYGAGTAVSRKYAADWDTGTPLVRPETGGPSITNSACITSSVTNSAGTSLVGLLNFPSHTCTSVSTGTYHYSGAANPKFLTLYFNGPGYATKQSQVKGVSFKMRARCSVSGGGTFTLTMFYVKPDGTRVNSPVSTRYNTSTYRTATISLAGQTFQDVPAGSRLGIQIGVSRSSCGIGLGGAVDSNLVVEETAEMSTGINIGDGSIVIGSDVLAGSTGNVVDSFTLSAPMGVQTISSVTVTGGPTTTAGNVAAVKLYSDAGTLGELDPADTFLGSGTFIGNSATISGLSETVNGTLRRYLVAYDINQNPQTNVILTGLVTSVGGSVTVDSNWDISSATINIVPTTTVTNGSSEPPNIVLPSGGTATRLDAFGVRINGGSDDTINTVTVSLLPAGVSKKIARLEIVDRVSGRLYGELTAPSIGDDWRISTSGLIAGTTTTECYVRMTPKEGVTTVIPVTGRVTAVTHVKGKYGLLLQDTSGATITLDGEAPGNPIITASPGSVTGQIQLSWTPASDSSGLHASRAYTVVRGIANAPAPANCSSGVQVYQGSGLSATENGLSPGQHYGYRVCATDTVNNVSRGTTSSAIPTIPNVCNNTPSIVVMPSGQFVKSGGQAEYTVSVTNNDTGACSPATFALSLVGTENAGSFIIPSVLASSTMNLSPNGNGATTTLTMTAKPSAVQGATNSLSIRVTSSGHPTVTTDVPVTAMVNDSSELLHSSLTLGQLKYGTWGTDYTCATCHSKGRTTNIKKVSSAIQTPTGERPVVFTVITAATNVATGMLGNDLRGGTTSSNICEVCHHKTRFHQYSAGKTAWKDHNNGKDCMVCHPHSIGFKAVGGQCSDCHGNPPTSFSNLAFPPTNALGSYAPNAGAHARHSDHMGCATCHANGNHASTSTPRRNGLIEMGFIINGANFPGFNNSVTNGTLFTGTDVLSNGYLWSAAPGTTLVKVPNTTTCNVYCHGWPGSGGTNSIPSWIGISQKTCGTCHDATGDTPPASGSHRKHAGTDAESDGIKCGTCHGTYSNYSTSTLHINGQVEWNLSAISSTAAYNGSNSGTTGRLAPGDPAGYGTCTNLYCHSNVQSANGTGGPTYYASPRWGDTADCGGCHDDMAVSASPTGAHRQHAKDPVTQFDCRICHGNGGDANANRHGNQRIDFLFGGLAANTRYSRGTEVVPGSGSYGTCSASNCHGRDVVRWEPESQLPLCDKCHGSAATSAFYDTRGPGSPTGKTEPHVGSHDQHVKASPYAYASSLKCSECHIEPGGPYTPQHIDSALPAEVGFDQVASAGIFYGYTSRPWYDYSTRTCNNLWCHGAGMDSNTGKGAYGGCVDEGGSLGTAGAPKWNDVLLDGTAGDCSKCHSYPPCSPGPGYVHYNKAPADCKDCHNNLNSDGITFNNPSLHVNGVVDGCFTCHGRPPVDMASMTKPELKALSPGNAGAHNAHQLNPSIDGNCYVCHDNYDPTMPGYTLEIGFKAYGGRVTTGTFYGYSTIINNRYVSSNAGTVMRRTTNPALLNTCVNVYCHGGGTSTKPPMAGGSNTKPNWEMGYGEVACGTCHGVTGATYATTGSHSRHAGTGPGGLAMACAACHGEKVNNYHVNGSVEWRLDTADRRFGPSALYRNISSGTTGDTAPSASFGSCTNVYCHSNVQGAGGIGAPSGFRSPVWGGPSPGCGGCHKNMATDPAATGSHSTHANSYACGTCHAGAGSGSVKHADQTIDIAFDGTLAGTTYSAGSHAAGSGPYGTCRNITCHGGRDAVWGGSIDYSLPCLGCHAGAQGSRAAISPQFGGNSHHVQGVTLTNEHCYQCHWEANSDGTINSSYHQRTAGAAVDLVVYTGGVRPSSYAVGSTTIRYVANGTRAEIAKLNTHCLGCHSDAANGTTPFGDGKTPKHYAWDGNSIAARYGNTGTTRWGKYSSASISRKNTVVKAFSAHGNAVANHGGWDTSEKWTDSRNGSASVLCFDCHNSHGSSIDGTTTSYASATVNGGILKDTAAGKGGYSMTYKPMAGGSAADHNLYNPGAGLCFDCHLNATAGITPWGYNSTFGAVQQILGYMDTPRFGSGTFPRQSRYGYKATPNYGGHFGASTALSGTSSHAVGGLCTPCHDPHGVSPSLGANQGYAVPLLKGTWLSSPYKEDVSPADNQNYVAIGAIGYTGEYEGPTRSQAKLDAQKAAMNSYRIDQNTFGPGGNTAMNSTSYKIVETQEQFAGLCLRCHPKQQLTNGTNHVWKSKDRVHESVKGWKTANATAQHSYSCSKCHAPHNASLPRLMVTNCLDSKHRGRMVANTNPVTSGSYRETGYGSGRKPGSYSAHVGENADWYNNKTFTCHENNSADQMWNTKTPW